MRVLIFSQHFAPELTAARFRVEAFARGLRDRGHDVHVVCAVPNHPDGVIRQGYRGRPVLRREVDGISTTYVWVRASTVKSFARRLSYYGSYAAMAMLAASLGRRPDVVLATSPPLSVGAAGALVARRFRVPWVFDVRDIWPDVAVALGELRNARAIGAAAALERRLYSSAAAITTVTEGFAARIAARAGDPGKVELIPNGTIDAWLDAGELDVAREDVGLPRDRFVWAYAGNVGLSHGLGVAVEAADRLGEGFQLLIMGEGPQLASLRARASALPTGRVVFREPLEPERAAPILRACDALLVVQRADLTDVISSKLYDCCAVGRPVVAGAEGEMRELIERAGAAVPVAADDAAALAGAVRDLRDDPKRAAAVAAAGRRFAAEHTRARQAQRLAELLETAAAS